MPDFTRYGNHLSKLMKMEAQQQIIPQWMFAGEIDMNPFFEQLAASKKAEATCEYCGKSRHGNRCQNCGAPRGKQ